MGGSEMSESDKGDDKPPEADGKIKRSLKSMLKQMKLSDDEMTYRMENFDNVDVVKEYLKYLKCTKCNMNFQQVIKKGETVGIHPLLGVLMCDSCCDYYGDGNFSLDSEGEDKYCRWCGEGGTIFACSKCICGFCDVCIKKHFGEKGLESVEKDDDWICYFCNPQPLWYLRSICFLAKEAARNKRELIKKCKEGASVKKKRRKIEDRENDLNKTSDGSVSSSCDSNSSSTNSKKKQTKRKRYLRHTERTKRDDSSSSEDEKENHVNSKRRIVKSKKQSLEGGDPASESSGSDAKTPKKRVKISSEENEFETKRALILQKLKSIWRLTQTITEVGLSSSRDRLRNLSRCKYSTMDRLKKEYEDLKSCMNVLVSSLNTASNSVNSINEDLTFDTTKDETESFRSQEIKLKTFAEKFHEESNDKTSVNSVGNSFRKEIKEKEGRKKQPVRGTKKSVRETVVKKKLKSDDNSEEEDEEKSSAGENESKSLFSDEVVDPDSDEEGKKRDSEKGEEKTDENDENRDSGKESGTAKPLLKVKSFARMLDENVYDKNASKKGGTPIVVDLYDIDTDESENESKKKGSPGGEKEENKSRAEKKDCECDQKKPKKCMNGGKVTSNGEENIQRSVGKQRNGTERSTAKEGKRKISSKESEAETVTEENKNEDKGSEKSSSGSETEDDACSKENGKSSEGNSEGGDTNKTDVEKRSNKCATDDKNQEKSSGTEEINSSEQGKDQEKEDGTPDEKESQSSTGKESDGGKRKKSDDSTDSEEEKKRQSDGENVDKEESSEEENEKSKEFDAETTTDDDEDLKKTEGEKAKEKEIEESQEQSKDSGDDSRSEEASKACNESENKKKSSGSDSEGSKMSASKGDKSDSSGGESKKSSDEEKNTRKTRRQKKDVKKVSFEKFKRKRERYLKSCKENSKPESEKEEVSVKKALESSESEDEKKVEKKNLRPKKKRILASSDEENEGNEGEKSKDTTTSSEESEKENVKQESEAEEAKPSSGSESSSEEEVDNKKRKRIRKRQKGSSDSSEEDAKKKKKRKASSSESSEDEKTKKRKKGRKNIKKILKKDSLQVETKEALKNEEERKKRLKERQKLFEELFPQDEEQGTPKRLILDFNPETKEPLVTVHKKLVKKLKPHQAKGIKFMWDNCFESVQKLEEESGSGCILAHCMGLGKTLQVITLVHTVMTHDLGVNTVLVVCPLSTVSNWIREFETWLQNIRTDPITLYDLVRYKKREERLFHLENWHESGGVLVVSYDLFRNLTKVPGKKEKKKKPKFQQIFEKTLLDPGPDLVICDEGHLLKNEETALSKCMSRVKTSRRIVLTGTPLQNNLIEYHCMVQFVKPNILGTKKEFCNRFVNPINNGQFEDSTELDVKIMKRRSHVLHSMLDGCIQRFDYSVLTPFLPEKHEYVLAIELTEKQAKAYMHFINNLSAKSCGSSRAASLFNDYHTLQRIWTHPRTMLMQSERETQREELDRDSEGSLKDFVVSTSEESERSGSESSEDSVQEVAPRKRVLRSNANDPDVIKAIEEEEKLQNKHWWDEFYDEKAYDDIRESNKLVVLFSLLKNCWQKKDKILVFSQSLYSLDLIEYFLARIDENTKKDDEALCGYRDNWILGRDYFRLDGSTSSETRAIWCKNFNKESNTRARLFLISTRAGGLGINLYGANRVVIFDASWNPSHDLQSIFRVYRFGQKKPCYIYRFLSEATMEEKIYERQVTKLSLAHRVVDEHQIERHYTMGNLQELYAFQPTARDVREIPKLPKDSVLADILAEHKEIVVRYHEHDSLLENKQEEELTEEERKAAWKEYEEEKTQKTFNFNAAMEQHFMMMQQHFAQGAVGMQQMFNPAGPNPLHPGQNYINPMFIQNIPLETLQKGVQLGVTPLPNESPDSYRIRVFNREAWLQVKQAQGQSTAP